MKSILFVDDDENLLNALKRILHKKREEWSMDFITSPKDALVLLQNKKYDCVVVDFKMPEVNGLELLKLVANNNPEVKRVLLSGQVDEDVYAKAKSITHAYLSKPCEPEELLKTLEELLR